jgi:hypothetical protein
LEDNAYKWRDLDSTIYSNGTSISDLSNAYIVLVPYTLTNDDVEVVDGVIVSCDYNYAGTQIMISGELDGQTIVGLGESLFSDQVIASIDLSTCTSLATIGKKTFYNVGQMFDFDFSALASLNFIGDYAFGYSDISSIDLSACTELDSIGEYAFFYNEFSEIDLSNCSNLIKIGAYAFYNDNSLAYLTLPNVDVDGYTFEYWVYNYGGVYDVGIFISDNTKSLDALLSLNYYELSFTVTDGSNAIAGATVSLDGYGDATTDAAGKVMFSNVILTSALAYDVTGTGYVNTTGTITASLANESFQVSKSVSLSENIFSGISDADIETLTVYPNPATTTLNVSGSKGIAYLYNLTGTIVLSQDLSQSTSVNISGLSYGMYLLKVDGGVIKVVKK